jgi:7-carboxy-7-deazaguanine synthase (Cx14CxxC type)
MSYAVKEIFKSLQGEGAHAGRAAVFCRFSGCNLWNGLEEDRATAACNFCDTDFVGMDGEGGGRFATAADLADAITSAWGKDESHRYVVLTGGEPLLQVDDELVMALRARKFELGVETNGTQPAPDGLDWICVSPKGKETLKLTSGDELKLVFPQHDAPPERFETLTFDHFWLQPMDGPEREAATAAAIDYCLQNPRWRISLQTHKMMGIP